MNTRTKLLSFSILLGMTFWTSTLMSCSKNTGYAMQPEIPADTITSPAIPDTALKHYLALGDSYTIGQSVKVNERYPVQTVERLRISGFRVAEAEIIATSGWTTRNLLNAVNDKDIIPAYDMVTLLIGVNNQYQGGSREDYGIEFNVLLKKAIHFAGGRPQRVIVLSIPDYSVTPFANNADKEKIVREIDSFNFINKRIADSLHVNYLNVTDESRKAAYDRSLIAFDDLHFSGKEYSIWTNLLVPIMKQALK